MAHNTSPNSKFLSFSTRDYQTHQQGDCKQQTAARRIANCYFHTQRKALHCSIHRGTIIVERERTLLLVRDIYFGGSRVYKTSWIRKSSNFEIHLFVQNSMYISRYEGVVVPTIALTFQTGGPVKSSSNASCSSAAPLVSEERNSAPPTRQTPMSRERRLNSKPCDMDSSVTVRFHSVILLLLPRRRLQQRLLIQSSGDRFHSVLLIVSGCGSCDGCCCV